MILHPKHSTSGKTRQAHFLGGTQEADLVLTHMTSIVLETQQVGSLAGSPLCELSSWSAWWNQGCWRKVEERRHYASALMWSPWPCLAGPFWRVVLVFFWAADFSRCGWGEGRHFSEACWPSYLNWTVELKLEWTALICWIMNPIQKCFSLTVKKPSLSP